MGFIDFTNGEVLTADQMDLVMRQGIMRFADASARDTALSEVLAEGMMAYLDDTNEVLKYDGSDWVAIVDTAESIITTQGDLIIGDASGDPVRLPVGSANQVLTSDGTTVSFEDAGGGGMTLLSTNSLTGLTELTVSSIDQTYESLIIYVYNIYLDIANRLNIKVRNGVTDLDFFAYTRSGNSSNSFGDRSQFSNKIITREVLSIDSGESQNQSAKLDIFNYSDTAPKPISMTASYQDDNANDTADISAGAVVSSSAINAVNISAGTSTFESGTVEIWGVK